MEGVIFVVGVYGVGKSTMCSSLSGLLDIDFYSAGDLISECNKEIYGRNKKVKDKDNNQNVLVECVEHKLQEKDSIILAGHFCILGNDDKPDILPEFVYEKILVLEYNYGHERLNNLYLSKRSSTQWQKIKNLMRRNLSSKLLIYTVKPAKV